MNVAQAHAAAVARGTGAPVRTYRLDRGRFGVSVTWEAPEPGASGTFTRPDYDPDIVTLVAALRRSGFTGIA